MMTADPLLHRGRWAPGFFLEEQNGEITPRQVRGGVLKQAVRGSQQLGLTVRQSHGANQETRRSWKPRMGLRPDDDERPQARVAETNHRIHSNGLPFMPTQGKSR